VTPPGSPSAPIPRKAPNAQVLDRVRAEAVSSQVTEIPFEAALQGPEVVIGARYDDRAELVGLGIEVDGDALTEAELRRGAEPFPGRRARLRRTPPAGGR